MSAGPDQEIWSSKKTKQGLCKLQLSLESPKDSWWGNQIASPFMCCLSPNVRLRLTLSLQGRDDWQDAVRPGGEGKGRRVASKWAAFDTKESLLTLLFFFALGQALEDSSVEGFWRCGTSLVLCVSTDRDVSSSLTSAVVSVVGIDVKYRYCPFRGLFIQIVLFYFYLFIYLCLRSSSSLWN